MILFLGFKGWVCCKSYKACDALIHNMSDTYIIFMLKDVENEREVEYVYSITKDDKNNMYPQVKIKDDRNHSFTIKLYNLDQFNNHLNLLWNDQVRQLLHSFYKEDLERKKEIPYTTPLKIMLSTERETGVFCYHSTVVDKSNTPLQIKSVSFLQHISSPFFEISRNGDCTI
jgi:hypothetical protein